MHTCMCTGMCVCVGGGEEEGVKIHAVSEDHNKYMTPNHIITTQLPLAVIDNKETFPGPDHKGSSFVLHRRLCLVLGSLLWERHIVLWRIMERKKCVCVCVCVCVCAHVCV